MASQPVYQFYSVLDDFDNRVWRRFQVGGNITVARLGYILMTLYEMRASHLFSFSVSMADNFKKNMLKQYTEEQFEEEYKNVSLWNTKMRFQILDEDEEVFLEENEKLYDAAQEKMKRAFWSVGDVAVFEYDFGDGWCVTLELESITQDGSISGGDLPRVLEGAGYGIVEDCGGVGGLDELAKAFKAKEGEEYDNLRQWLGTDDFDIDSFDIDDMNFRLKKIPRIYMQAYEQRLMPTQRSIDLIERKYLEG